MSSFFISALFVRLREYQTMEMNEKIKDKKLKKNMSTLKIRNFIDILSCLWWRQYYIHVNHNPFFNWCILSWRWHITISYLAHSIEMQKTSIGSCTMAVVLWILPKIKFKFRTTLNLIFIFHYRFNSFEKKTLNPIINQNHMHMFTHHHFIVRD